MYILKVNFLWMVPHGKILNVDYLMKRGFHIPNRCYLFKAEEESIKHIFLDRSYASKVWSIILHMFPLD